MSSTHVESTCPSPKKAEELSLPHSSETAQAADNEDTLIVVHDAADTTLVVEGAFGVTTYKVSGMNLATASDVLRALIYGKGKPKNSPGTDVTLDVGDVDPEALNILLRISHFDFAEVPSELSLDNLCAVTTLTSKFQCTTLIMPWATKWLLPHAGLLKDESCNALNFKAANIAWELGSTKLFRQMVKDMTMSAKVDSEGYLVHTTGTKIMDLVLPAGILDQIVAIRTDTIDKILTSIQAAFDNVTKKTGDIKYCKTGIDSEKCETMMLGSAVTQLLQAGLFPVPNVAIYQQSINTLVHCIDGITLHHWEGKNYAPHTSHTGCDLQFKENAKAATKGMTDPLKEAHLEHLKKQSAASGVVDEEETEVEWQSKRTRVVDTISGSGELLSRSRSTSPKANSSKITAKKECESES
ncbi:uncharacterized protein PG998_004805 [Apiospora kogelbergensis]|uniref:uncharacterized protein n=1 Tax=Apiospora kogelbergensis TaxID=1337665 RepID=UPI0031326B99